MILSVSNLDDRIALRGHYCVASRGALAERAARDRAEVGELIVVGGRCDTALCSVSSTGRW